MDELGAVLEGAGGIDAPAELRARLHALLAAELVRGEAELGRSRSGYDAPGDRRLRARSRAAASARSLPVAPALRADPDAAAERAWLLAAAVVGALAEAGARAGRADGRRLGRAPRAARRPAATPSSRRWPSRSRSPASTGCARARSPSRPPSWTTSSDLREPIGAAHPLRVAAAIAALGGRPADPASVAEHEEAVLAALERASPQIARPHDDPDPSRRVARRILQRLDGMGKWGGYHTDFTHLARGFAGNDRALADAVGEALLERRAAAGEAERRPAPRLPQPAPRGRHPRADRRAAAAAGRAAPPLRYARGVAPLAQLDRLGDPLFLGRTLVRAGLVRPERPDRLVRALDVLRRWGPTIAAGYSAGAIRRPDAVAIVDERGTLTFAEVDRAHERARPRARRARRQRGRRRRDPGRNHRWFVEATVALGKLGANALYLNTMFAAPQIADVCEREQPVAIVHDEEFAALVARGRPTAASASSPGPTAPTPTARRRSRS